MSKYFIREGLRLLTSRWFRAALCSAVHEIRCRAPGATRKRFEVSDSVDVGNRFVCTHRSSSYRAEYLFAIGPLQFPKSFRAFLKSHHRLLSWRAIGSGFFFPIRCPDWGGLNMSVRQSAHFSGYQGRVSHRICTQLCGTHAFRPAGNHSKSILSACELGQARRVVECMKSSSEPLFLFLRFGWAAHLRYVLPCLAQRIAGFRHRSINFSGTARYSMTRSRQRLAD